MKGQDIAPWKTQLWVWATLIILLLGTFGSAYIPLGPFNLVVNILIAIGQMLLVLTFFMHLRYRGPLVRIFAAAGFFWLLFLFGFTLSDYLTRPEPVSADKLAYVYPGVSAKEQSAHPPPSSQKRVEFSPQAAQLKPQSSREVNLKRGKAVYQETCSACHGTGALGAPKMGEKAAWSKRATQGLETLVSHAMNGYKAMPPKGGNQKLSVNEIRNGIVYMLTQSKVVLGQKK
ncbi:c-type cytochrome [Nitrosococcus watsonii]|uniref:Caa(3)-type oxidase, subunit IV n=1 Tax=Nitrosococcus watsoni (strain C-113) TaxID=105559 RepID=D8K592_NITWC|nr:c-type cytochrome [Nitrosococcus watsonii]ADJ28069.1 caa(3)-type oxidase, subunit IV [Nitrosococcus watsonii C-113]